ncbi:MAG: glutamate synthase subunit beta [SAR324 cluster bacterium]|nr:glutamate synthase subunit beta [SAR324 cluster bacterium]
MNKDRGFLEIEKEDVPKRPIEERLKDYKDYNRHYSEPAIRSQANRCMDCGIPFCHTGCPLGNLIPDWNNLAARGQWHQALDSLHSTNNFPEFTGNVCPAPCEDSCVLNEYYTLDPEEKKDHKYAVTIEQIERHTAEFGWKEGWIKPQPATEKTGKKVAIIGSGPAGLAAAQQLARVGHTVTVFEKEDRPGGLLRYGIPDFKLEKINVDRRIEQMKAEGVEFRTGVHVGVDFPVRELKESFDAILISTGAGQARKLRIPGNELQGIHYALDFLPQQNRVNAGDQIAPENRISAEGKQVVVIGGGFTGADCVGTSNRQGATGKKYQFELVDMTPRPTPVHKEAEWDCRGSIMTEEIVGENGKVKALKAVKLQWKKENGRMTMEKIPGSEFTVPVDMVFLAMGFLGPKVEGLVEGLGVELSVRGRQGNVKPAELIPQLVSQDPMYNIHADQNFMTSEPGVFAAGDARRGASLVVWAIWEGREAARCIDKYLMGKTTLPTSPQTDKVV